MNTEHENSRNTVGTELALIRQRLDTVIETHDRHLTNHDVLIGSTSSQISVLQLQSNTHEVKIADLQQKAMGMFGKMSTVAALIISALAFVIGISK